MAGSSPSSSSSSSFSISPPLPLPPRYSPPAEPLKLIIDSDPGVDDVLAFLLALSLPHVHLLAITLTFGNTTLDYARDNVLRTFEVLKKEAQHQRQRSKDGKSRWDRIVGDGEARQILLALGAQGPLMGIERFTASYFHGRDGLSSISSLPGDPHPLPIPPNGSEPNTSRSTPYIPSPLSLSSSSSPSLILSLLASHPPHTIRIAALGPLTNLAQAWLVDPATFSRVGLISVMGGSLDEAGNTSPVAEFNTYADPWAAKVLFEESVGHECLRGRRGRRLPIELLPLDITGRHTVLYENLMREHSPLGKFITAILTHPRKMTNSYAPSNQPFSAERDDLFQAHDPLAVAHACFALSEAGRGGEAYHLHRGEDGDHDSRGTEGVTEGGKRADSSDWSYVERRFAVEVEGKMTRGMCVVDRRAHGSASTQRSGRSRAELIQEEEERKALVEPSRGQCAIAISSAPPHQIQDQQDAAAREPAGRGPEGEVGIPGLVSVVEQSPLQGTWFADVFLWALRP